jgi:hypothetical protein
MIDMTSELIPNKRTKYTTARRDVWVTSLSPPPLIEVPVPSQEGEAIMSLFTRGIHFASFYNFSVGFWKCSDAVKIFAFILITQNTIPSIQLDLNRSFFAFQRLPKIQNRYKKLNPHILTNSMRYMERYDRLWLWYFAPISTILQLFRDDQFYCLMKLEYPVKTTDLSQVTAKHLKSLPNFIAQC